MTTSAALVVDTKGLAKKLAHRPKSFVLFELIQNAWDAEGVSLVVVSIERRGGQSCRITVEDNAPAGFTDLASVYTMFRDSEKAGDPEKRGRFELGEKLIAALARRMEVATTKGTVIIEGGKRTHLRAATGCGSTVTVYLSMTKEEFGTLLADATRLIAPAGVRTYVNAQPLPEREPQARFEAQLETIRADSEGVLRTTTRKAQVDVFSVEAEATGYLYEMGIPVVETGDSYSYNVHQRVPVNWERNSVPPAYLRALRVASLNALHAQLSDVDVALPWVADALDDARCAKEAVAAVVQKRFGDKVVINDPSDPEGTKLAVSAGYTVIHGGTFSRGAWQHIREHGLVLPAGQVTPSPKPYSPDGEPENLIPPDQWTPDMGCRAEFCKKLFAALVTSSAGLAVAIVNEPAVGWSANFGPTGPRLSKRYRLCLNVGRLGHGWFAEPHSTERVVALLIHEFGHFYASDHLSSTYHEALCGLGARLGIWASTSAQALRD